MFEANQTFSQFLDDYYSVGPRGYLEYLGKDKIKGNEAELRKILTYDETNFYQASYARGVQMAFATNTELFRLLDKKPITSQGDSFKYTMAHALTKTALAPGGQIAIFGAVPGTTTEPTIGTVTAITAGIHNYIMMRDIHSMVREKVPNSSTGVDWAWLTQELAPVAMYDDMDKWLGGQETVANVHGVDTPAVTNIECIDRMISNLTESGAAVHVSADTDGDVFWDGVGTGAAKIDRSTTPGYDWANSQIKLPAVAGTPDDYEIVKELETLMTVAKRYSKNKRYIGVTSGATMNKIQREIDPKQRFGLDREVDVRVNINGVETRPGVQGGFSVGALVLAGVTVPFFTSEAVPSDNTVYPDSAGHVYLIDLDSMYIRVDIPVTFLETGFGPEMLAINYLQSRGLLFTLAQLVCTNFQANAALKWIAS